MAVENAAQSLGSSNDVIHDLVGRVVRTSHVHDVLVDVGCGTGRIVRALDGAFRRYIGCDALRYEGFPDAPWASFVQADLDRFPYPIEDASADAVLAIEVIEHLENPRAFVRELVRILKPGGRLIVTTPNQLSLLSKLTLVLRNEFNAFQEAGNLYPAHITALVELDLRHIAMECKLRDIEIRYTDSGRIPFTARHWPRPFRGRAFSDNVLLTGVKP